MEIVRSKTKTRFLHVALMLLSLGWAQPGWAAHLDADMRELPGKLRQEFESARTGPYGTFVYKNISTIAIVYALVALSLLLKPDYRDKGWKNLWISCIAPLVFFACFVVGYGLAETFHEINEAHGGMRVSPVHDGRGWLIVIVTGVLWPLLIIAIGLSAWVGIPLYLLFLLFTLPSILFVLLRFLVRLPILIYHHLHYLTVPHPAETAYRAGIANDLPMEELASVVADAMYESDFRDFAALPKAWKSKNWTKRIDAFHARLEAQDRFIEELKKNLRLKHQVFRE